MLRIHTQKLGDVSILRLQGQVVTGDVISRLRNAVLSQSHVEIIVLDLKRVTRMDARGLGLLLELREQTQSNGSDLRLVNVPRLLRRLFQITRLDSVFHISTEDEALAFASLGRSPEIPEFELAPSD
jgi:anti-anti-sigma factor